MKTLSFYLGMLTTIVVIYFGLVMFVPAPSQAGLVPACGINGACGFCDIVDVFITLGRWLITGGAGLGLVLIVWAGIGLIMSGGSSEKIGAAKKQILGVIIGLGLVLAAFQFVTMIIAFVVTPSQLTSFSGSQSEEAKKIGNLSNFLGVPWWTICSKSELRAAGSANEGNSKYGGTAVCKYWGDGTACQNLTSEEEAQLEAQLDKGETPTNIKRCCRGACVVGECVTEQITRTVTEARQPTGVPGVTLDITDEQAVREYLAGGGVLLQNNKPSCSASDPKCEGKANVAGLPITTLNTLKEANGKCPTTSPNCIIITGGTENGHSSHCPGRNVVDIDYSEEARQALEDAGIHLALAYFAMGYTCEKNGRGVSCFNNPEWLHIEIGQDYTANTEPKCN